MLQKLSVLKPSCSFGILKVRLFHIYSKKKKVVLKLSWFGKSSVKKTITKRKSWVGRIVKTYAVNTKYQILTKTNFLVKPKQSKAVLKHKKMRRRRFHYGFICRFTKLKKFFFMFSKRI